MVQVTEVSTLLEISFIWQMEKTCCFNHLDQIEKNVSCWVVHIFKPHGRTSRHYASSPLLPVIWCLATGENTTRPVREATQAAEWVIFKPLPPFKVCATWIFSSFFFPPVLRERFQSETKAQSCFLGNSMLPSPLTLRRRTSVMSWRVHPSLSQDDSRIISYSRRIEASKMGAGYYPTGLWGGLQTPPLFQFCPSRTDGKIRVLQTLRLARAGPCLLWVISMDMQWNGAWILPEPAMLCWAPSFPHRN